MASRVSGDYPKKKTPLHHSSQTRDKLLSMMKTIRSIPIYCAIFLLVHSAWGQIAPQEEPILTPQTKPSMHSSTFAPQSEDSESLHTLHGISRRGYNIFNPRDRALLRYYYYRHLLDQERAEIESAKEDLKQQQAELESRAANISEPDQSQIASIEPPTVIREYRFFQPPIQLDPLSVQRYLLRRAEQERAAAQKIDDATPMETEPTPTPTPVRLRSASEILFDQGLNAFQLRNYFNALRTFEQLNQAAPNNPRNEFAYGLSLFAFYQFDRASEILPKVIDEAKRSGQVLPALSEFYSSERDYLSHRAALKRRLDENPDNAQLATLYLSLPSQFPHEEEIE